MIGPEYRIRFLIALLEYKFGIHLYAITEKELEIVFDLISASNAHLSIEAFEEATEESRFFCILMVLMWKRKDFAADIPESPELTRLKTLFIYPKLMSLTKNIMESALEITFTQADYDYLFLAYCTDSQSFFQRQMVR